MKKSKNNLFHPAVFIPLLLVFFVVAVVLAKVLLWPAIKLRQATEHKQSAQKHLENENYRNAFADIQKAILKNPDDLESYEIALAASEKSQEHLRYVPAYLDKLMEMDPENPVHFQKYILLTLRLGAGGEAREVFERYPAAAQDSKEYHQLGYSIGSGLKDTTMAQFHLSKLVELNPEDDSLKLFLSTLQLRSSEDESARNDAQSSLEAFASAEDSKIPALRVLLTHALVEQNIEEVSKYLEELDRVEPLPLIDQLLTLQARKVVDEDRFPQLVDAFLSEVAKDSIGVRLIIEFLLKNQLAQVASDWIETLPAELASLPEVSRKISQVYYETEDWNRLESKLMEGNWNDEDFGRLLLLALTSRKGDDPISFQNYWKECLVKVGTNRRALKSLFQTVSAWGWIEESVEVLEIRFREEPGDDEVFQLLTNHFMSIGATDKTIQTLERRVEFIRDDSNSKNNLALLSLLTGTNEGSAFNYAQENYQEEENNPYFLTTWALALSTRDRANESLALLETLSEDQRNDPQRAVYLAQIHLSAGNFQKAENYAAKADSSKLFKEEKELLSSIKETLAEDNN